MLDAFFSILGLHDSYTVEHSLRVSRYASSIARSMTKDEDTIKRVHNSAAMHDIGKAFIPASLLNKTEKLTCGELETVKSHALAGYALLNQFKELADIAEIVLHHHEQYNGNGYPCGLKASQIPLESRIVTVADSFDAITTARTYRNAISTRDAISEISCRASYMFDPDVIDHFVRIMSVEPFSGPVQSEQESFIQPIC